MTGGSIKRVNETSHRFGILKKACLRFYQRLILAEIFWSGPDGVTNKLAADLGKQTTTHIKMNNAARG
jgi:hypothetical protein